MLAVRRSVQRCRARALVALVDEAHTLDLAVGQLLLNVSQEVRTDAPFLLARMGYVLEHHTEPTAGDENLMRLPAEHGDDRAS